MLTRLQVANLAIGHTGSGEAITSFEDDSTEARAVKEFIGVSEEIFLKSQDWGFARRTDIPLALEEEMAESGQNRSTYFSPYRYRYAYPKDCLNFRYVVFDGQSFSHKVVNGPGGKSILTNVARALGWYTGTVEDGKYDSDAAMMWSIQLAILIAPQLTQGNSAKVMNQLAPKLEMFTSIALENNYNEDNLPTFINPAIEAGGWNDEYGGL